MSKNMNNKEVLKATWLVAFKVNIIRLGSVSKPKDEGRGRNREDNQGNLE